MLKCDQHSGLADIHTRVMSICSSAVLHSRFHFELSHKARPVLWASCVWTWSGKERLSHAGRGQRWDCLSGCGCWILIQCWSHSRSSSAPWQLNSVAFHSESSLPNQKHHSGRLIQSRAKCVRFSQRETNWSSRNENLISQAYRFN